MNSRQAVLAAIVVAPALASCATGPTLAGANLPSGAAAYSAFSAPTTAAAAANPQQYQIAPFDSLAVTVFDEPNLSTPANSPLQVDASGDAALPLVGTVHAAGKTTSELSSIIAARLARSYLRNPQVTVAVANPSPNKVTVQGEVQQAGVFDIKGKTTLLQAISLAHGETKLAATNQVAVFRTVNGQRMGALFNVDEIRRGSAPDPQLLPNDVVIVGHSRGKEAWQNFLSVNPLYGVFRIMTGVGI
jgi:polysaccharide export outer membrane protein